MTFGEEFGIGSDAATSQAILDRYLDRGGNFIDTANIYNGGRSEEIIGRATPRAGRGWSSPPSSAGACRRVIPTRVVRAARR